VRPLYRVGRSSATCSARHTHAHAVTAADKALGYRNRLPAVLANAEPGAGPSAAGGGTALFTERDCHAPQQSCQGTDEEPRGTDEEDSHAASQSHSVSVCGGRRSSTVTFSMAAIGRR